MQSTLIFGLDDDVSTALRSTTNYTPPMVFSPPMRLLVVVRRSKVVVSYAHHQTPQCVALILLRWGMKYDMVSLTPLLSQEQVSVAEHGSRDLHYDMCMSEQFKANRQTLLKAWMSTRRSDRTLSRTGKN